MFRVLALALDTGFGIELWLCQTPPAHDVSPRCKQQTPFQGPTDSARVSAQPANLFGASPGTILRLASSGISLEQGRGKYRGGVNNHKSKNC